MILGHSLSDFVSEGRARRVGGPSAALGASPYGLGWRVAAIRVLVVVIFLALFAGLARVQIFQGQYFRALADGNRVRDIPIHAARGIVYDRNGKALLANLPIYRLKTCDVHDQNCTSDVLGKGEAISLMGKGLPPGQTLEVASTRNYIYGPATAHLLGYVSEISAAELSQNSGYLLGDVVGRGGVEEEYEQKLRGQNGQEVVEVDAAGRQLRTLASAPPKPGEDLTLTVDAGLQKVVYNQIAGKVGAVVATNPNTGEVLAVASSPSFDPNLFTNAALLAFEQEQKISQILSDASQPLFDRAISGTYPSGSTFKIVTATAGLETGKITQDTVIDDPGILIVGPYKFPNWKYLQDGGKQGVLNVVSAIKVSNDIFFYRVGEWVGVDGLADWALKFGLANRLGIDLPGEAPGVFPTAAWRSQSSKDWYLGDTYHLAIGQGDLLVTPLQVNNWTSVMANGGKLCVPHVLGSVKCKDLGIKPQSVDLIREGMVAACSPGGTAYPLFDFKDRKGNGIQVACKTGTAEFGDPHGRTHAWLTGYAPAVNPTIAVTVLVEGGGEGSDVAAPMVKKILEAWFKS